jgi:hypothetical protein
MSLDEWRFADRTLKGAVYLTGVTCVIICVAYLSPYWLQSVPSEKLPSPKFTNLGRLLSWLYKNTFCCWLQCEHDVQWSLVVLRLPLL